MAEHSPGPWSVEDVTSGYDHDICLAYPVVGAGHPVLVATTFFDHDRDGPITARQADANARLIAAAPSLLAACKLLDDLDCCTGYTFPESDWPKLWAAIEAARAAIARAERKS